MANVKISQLPLATSPLDSTVEMPVVQGGITKRAGMTTIGFLQSGTSAVLRTAQDKMREIVSVKDFGAIGDGLADDRAAIQAAIDAVGVAGGGQVYIPAGQYRLVGALNVPWEGVQIVGAARRGTMLLQATASSATFNITGSSTTVQALGIRYVTQGTSGGNAIRVGVGFYNYFSDLYVDQADIALLMNSGANGVILQEFVFEDSTTSGIQVLNAANMVVTNGSILNGNTTTFCTTGAISLLSFVEGCNFVSVSIYQGVRPLFTFASVYAQGSRPAYNKFHGCYFDAGAGPAIVADCVEIDFTDCWFSNGRGAAGAGVELGLCDGIRFTGGQAINCGGHGAVIGASAKRVAFNGFATRGNSVDAANTYDGISVAANTTDFVIEGCIATNDVVVWGTQRYGINVAAGTSDRYIITGNLLTGNGTSGINDGGTGTVKYISYNTGYRTSNQGLATITSGGSSVNVNHGLSATPDKQDIQVTPVSDPNARFWVSNATSTQFTITTSGAVPSDAFFGWSARVKGA